MSNNQEYYYLSPQSVANVISICDAIHERNTNEISRTMARGLSDWLLANNFLTQRQAIWIKRNCTYHRLLVPAELADLEVPVKSKQREPAVGRLVSTVSGKQERGMTDDEMQLTLAQIDEALARVKTALRPGRARL